MTGGRCASLLRAGFCPILKFYKWAGRGNHELLPPRVQLRHDRSPQHRLLPLHPAAERGGVQKEAVRALRGGGEGRTEANSGGAGFSFFTHHANKTEQNASVVVAESSSMWLDKDAERLGWLPVGQGPFG